MLYKKLARSNVLLEETVRERTAELRESEARFRSLTELASDWYWEQDEHGNFTKVFGPVLEMLGISVSPLQGDTHDVPVDGWNAAERAKLKAAIAAREPFLEMVLSRTNGDGTQQKFQVSGEPMFSQSCRFVGYRGVGIELTLKGNDNGTSA